MRKPPSGQPPRLPLQLGDKAETHGKYRTRQEREVGSLVRKI